jgi:tRNA uridine 5-carbamoylmethylation protein Kti12
MPTLYLTRGIPGSGKSTYAHKWQAESPETRVLSNRDDLRDSMFTGKQSNHEREKIVTLVQQEQVRSALAAGLDVMVHDTNLAARFVQEWYKFSDDVQFVDFLIDLKQALMHNDWRAIAGGRDVPDEVITSFYDRYTPKGKLPEIPEREPEPIFPPYVYDPALTNAVLVDIDGTLANNKGIRNPYDTSLYHLDTVHEDIAHLVDILTNDGYRIIVVSGRDEEYRDVLVKWLNDHNIYVDEIHMRPTEKGHKREDSVIKNELYETKIKGRYNVSYILDDRNRVVKMWRSKGMRVLHVQDGDF